MRNKSDMQNERKMTLTCVKLSKQQQTSTQELMFNQILSPDIQFPSSLSRAVYERRFPVNPFIDAIMRMGMGPSNGPWAAYQDVLFQKTTNNKKQFLRLPASGNSSQKALKTEIKGINAMQVANALSSSTDAQQSGSKTHLPEAKLVCLLLQDGSCEISYHD
ncbi:hypothetical protein STEG23_001489 [Scotinomys teguina]